MQYHAIHRIIPCNESLHNSKIRDKNKCNFYPGMYTISHFLITSLKKILWKYWSTWLNCLSNIYIPQSNNTEECFVIVKQYILPMNHKSKQNFVFYLIYLFLRTN